MSVSNTPPETTVEFVEKVSENPDLRNSATAHGLEKVADQEGYDLNQTEMEMAIKEFVKRDLPTTDLDVDIDSMPGLSAHSGCSRCCE